MSDWNFDKRDIEFVLFDQFKLEDTAKMPRYDWCDRATYEMAVDSAYKLAAEQMAPHNQAADREGVRLEDGQVILPEVFESMYRQFIEGGWVSVSRNPEYGGMGMPMALAIASTEMFVAACPSFMFTPGLTDAAAHLVEAFGSQPLRDLYVERMYTGEWGGTMCLTEPGAGSAVGDLATRATQVEGEDHYLIEGNKIFISSGDHQLTENIVHLVLARVPGDPAGTRGISLFVVPKKRVSPSGEVLGSNDVTVSGVEHKMGIHASATCSLSFGDKGECQGFLVGERCKGIVYMFQMMNEARLVTGLQGSAIGNMAYVDALAYAKERKQGPRVTDRSKDAKSVAIIEHPDVRRNLMTMKVHAESIRALCYRVAALSDIANHSEDADARTHAQDLVDLLTPIAKAYSSDIGFKITELAIQVHGGYGYISEYGAEQAMRDVKIASLYEGTNGIQALDLLGRKMRQKSGGLFLTWLQDINEQLEGLREHETFGDLATQIDGAKNALAEAAFGFTMQGKKDPEYPMLHATSFLRMFGHVESARLLLEQASIAHDKLTAIWADKGVDPGDDEARRALAERQENVRFYEAKIQGARFFTYQILPEVRAILKSMQSGDRSALDVML